MINNRLGFYSAVIATALTTVFAIAMVIQNRLLSYGVCMVLSWSYVTLTCAFTYKASQEKKSLGYAGMVFASIYSTLITLVYFTQLTTVAHNSASVDVIKALRFEPGSWLFGIDILGYGIMAISTFFVGLSITPIIERDKWLKALLIIHGVFAPICVIFPMLNLFNSLDDIEAGSNMGMIGLEGWCLYFIPLMVLAALYFKKESGD